MMKRTGVPRLGPDEPPMQQNPNQYHAKSNEQVLQGFSMFDNLGSNISNEIQQPGSSNMHTLAQSAQPQILGSSGMLSVGGSGFGRSAPRASTPAVINYLKPSAVQYAPAKPPQVPPRSKPTLAPLPPLGRQSPAPPPAPQPPCQPPQQQFQRLKVEDALSYLDQVKYKFNTQPQVYNDFLDIMKEFKSQTIDTPGVITRVSNLFKGHPELIVGFNTFLPPGYKIEVQSNGQVSVSMPSPTGMGGTSGVLLPNIHHNQQSQQMHLLPVAASSSSIVHNLSVNTAPTNTLHQISQAHQQIEAAAIHHAPGTPPAGHAAPPAGQPVEFNHAIEYVNKIKSRFSRQPDKYKRFLEILHAYQRGHRDLKEPQAKQQTEQEVYSQVAKLFENQEDLLTEFGQFLPDAKAVTKPPEEHYAMPTPQNDNVMVLARPERDASPERFPAVAPHPHHAAPHQPQIPKHSGVVSSNVPAPVPQHHHLKRSPSFSSSNQLLNSGAPPAKKARAGAWGARDVSYAEAAKLATVHDLSFFSLARRALRHHHVYDNLLRCLLLFTNEIISSSELLSVTAPFLCRHPELQKWLQDFVGPPSPPHTPTATIQTGYTSQYTSSEQLFERARSRERERERERLACAPGVRLEPIGQPRDAAPAMDVDLTTCKRLGTSYCALPRDAAARRCSGRTALCKEVLNDTWVSFPTWSEDSTFVTSRKTQYEEYIYRCEDERFELDVVIETNASTIRVLEGVQKKLSRMSSEEAARFRLDECLGGASPTIHQRALRRIYGDKVAVDIIAGLKKNPVVAVPVVLRRLKAKEEEWREAQKGFNKQWREQNEKYYLKSLDHQGINFKASDLKAMRSKALYNELESAHAARKPAPHLVLDYCMQSRQEAIKIVRDTAELLIHHARRQTGIQKAEKRRIKQLLRHFLPDLFNHPRQPLSDDERDEEDKEDPPSPGSPCNEPSPDSDKTPNSGAKPEIKQESSESDNASDKSGKTSKNNKENKPKNHNTDSKDSMNATANTVKRSSSNEEQSSGKSDVKSESADPEDDFRDYPANEARFVCSMSWYLFLRVHGALCSRLAAARRHASLLARDQLPSAASALRLKPNNLPATASAPSQYYSALLDLVRGVLDGNVEAAAYEDAAREMLGIKAYPAYTLDKLVSIAVRQLQHCVSEPWSIRAAELAARGGMRGAPSYVRRARRYLKQHHAAFLVKVYGGDECKVTFELLEGSGGEGRTSPNQNNDSSRLSPTNQSCGGANGSAVSRLAAWSLYTERYARPDSRAARCKPVFLSRNAAPRARSRGAPPRNTHSQPPAPPRPAPPRRPRKPPPRLHDTQECTISPHYRYNTHSQPPAPPRPAPPRRPRKPPPRLHDTQECTISPHYRYNTHSQPPAPPRPAPPRRPRKPPPRLHDTQECTISPHYRYNTHSQPPAPPRPAPPRRPRKPPPRLHDTQECTISPHYRYNTHSQPPAPPRPAPPRRPRKPPPRLHDTQECTISPHYRYNTHSQPPAPPRPAPPRRPRKPPPRLHDTQECTISPHYRYNTHSQPPAPPRPAPPRRPRKPPPRLHDTQECTISPHYRYNTHSQPPAPPRPAPPRRPRKPPPRLHDTQECTISPHYRSRAVAFRELALYQPGALAAARASHARLHAARRDKFRAWLRARHHPSPPPAPSAAPAPY